MCIGLNKTAQKWSVNPVLTHCREGRRSKHVVRLNYDPDHPLTVEEEMDYFEQGLEDLMHVEIKHVRSARTGRHVAVKFRYAKWDDDVCEPLTPRLCRS